MTPAVLDVAQGFAWVALALAIIVRGSSDWCRSFTCSSAA